MNQDQDKSLTQKRIEKLKQELLELEGDKDTDKFETRKLKEFEEIGRLFKTRNFFGTYNRILDAFHIYILKEDYDEVDMSNVDRAFVIKELNEELEHARDNVRKLNDEAERES